MARTHSSIGCGAWFFVFILTVLAYLAISRGIITTRSVIAYITSTVLIAIEAIISFVRGLL